jgi:glycosyltransferase involved in cell wall biosynthesis
MHILLLNSLFPPHVIGGAEVSSSLLVEGLLQAGHRVTVASIALDGVASSSERDGLTCHYLPIRNVDNPFRRSSRSGLARRLSRGLSASIDSWNPWMAAAVGRIIAADRPDVVHTNNLRGFSAAAWGAARRQGIPIVHTLRDHYLLCGAATLFKQDRCATRCWHCRLWGMPRRGGSQGVDLVVGISRFMLDRHLAEGYFRGAETRVIHNAVDLAAAPARSYEGAEPARIGFLGQLSRTKGIDLLLQAFRGLDDAGLELHVGGTGDPAYLERLQRDFPSPAVRWHGRVEPAEFLDGIDLLVVPSLWDEPAGRVVPEAFRRALPVLASARGGLPEMVGDEGAGWTFDPDAGARALGQRILELMRAPRDLREASARAVARSSLFARTAMADAYVAAYSRARQLRADRGARPSAGGQA